jgi:hypothetical protein
MLAVAPGWGPPLPPACKPMTELPPLPRHVDPKLSKGVVRQEIRGLGSLRALTESVHAYLHAEVMLPTAKGRSLSSAHLWRVSERIAEDFAALGSCIHVERRRPARVGLPSKAFRYVAGHFVQHRGDGTAAIQTLRVKVTPKGCTISWGGSPITFLDHAAERLLQRLPEDKPRDPLCTIGVVLHEAAGFLVPSLRIADAGKDKNLAVPFGDGILLGEVVRVPVASLDAGSLFQEGNGMRPGGLRAIPMPLVPVSSNGKDVTEVLVLLTKTYVGPNELGSSRKYFLAKAREFIARNGHAFEADGLGALYPQAPIQEMVDMMLGGHSTRSLDDSAMDVIYRELADLHADPRFRAGMGSFEPAGETPTAYWHAARAIMEASMAERDARKGKPVWETGDPARDAIAQAVTFGR